MASDSPKPHGRPSIVKSSDPSTSLRVNEWRVTRKREADPCLRQAGLTAICDNVCAAYRGQAHKPQSRSLTPVRQRQATGFGMTRRGLQVRAESQQTAIAILDHELPLVPWHVAKSPSEFYALGGILGIECVGIFNDEVVSFAQGL